MRSALSFLTCFGGARPVGPSALPWFPAVGALLGAALGALWWGAAHVWPAPVPAALVVVGDLVLTGMLHVDGLIDSADGLLPPLERSRRLEVLRDPAAGAFGVASAAGVLLVRWAALSALRPSIVLVVGVWAISRALMAVVASVVPYARPSGIASGFLAAQGTGSSQPRRGSITVAAVVTAAGGLLVGGCALLVWHLGLPAAAVLAVELLAGCAVVGLGYRRLGGFTGDVLGAAGVVAETAALVTAAARW